MSTKKYVRLRYWDSPAKKRTVWAVKLGGSSSRSKYLVVDIEGDAEKHGGYDEAGREIVRKEIIIANSSDIVFEKPAHMNLKYGELEED